MKNSTLLFLLIFVSTALSITPVHAQTEKSLWLEANTTAFKTRETVIVTINGVSTTPFQGFTAQIRYDPSCLLPENGTSPIPGMNGLAVPQAPGLADVSFASTTPQFANGVLAVLQFQALKGCQTSLTIESGALVVRGETGLAIPITDVNINQTPVMLSIDSAEGNPQPAMSGESVLPLTPVSVSNPNPINWQVVGYFALVGIFIVFTFGFFIFLRSTRR